MYRYTTGARSVTTCVIHCESENDVEFFNNKIGKCARILIISKTSVVLRGELRQKLECTSPLISFATHI